MRNKRSSGTGLTEEDKAKARDLDLTVMDSVSYFFTLHVMPLNFPEFWPLVQSIQTYKSSESYERTRWRLAFQKYNEILPGYFNDYINSYLRYLKADDLQLKTTS
jgi:hypothetical protein